LQAIGRSRGGRTTKIHALSDPRCRPFVFALSRGSAADIKVLPFLLHAIPAARTLAADRAYDADHLRAVLLARGTLPVIPNKPDRKRRHPFDPSAYKKRNAVERMFCRLKDFRRIATRYDKLAQNYLAALCIAAAIAYWIK